MNNILKLRFKYEYHDVMKAFWRRVFFFTKELNRTAYNKILEHDGYFRRWKNHD